VSGGGALRASPTANFGHSGKPEPVGELGWNAGVVDTGLDFAVRVAEHDGSAGARNQVDLGEARRGREIGNDITVRVKIGRKRKDVDARSVVECGGFCRPGNDRPVPGDLPV
jgi:hypothetical protein